MNTPLPTLVAFTFLFSLPITLALSVVVGWRYRAGVRRLMRLAPRPSEADGAGPVDTPPAARRHPAGVSLKARERRLVMALAALSLLIGFTSATLYLLVHFGGLAPVRLLILGLVMATPGLVLQAQILRWPFPRQLLALGGWGLALLLLVRLASAASGQNQLGLVLPQLLGPLIVLGLLFGIPRLRAIAPFLFPPVVLLVLLAVLGQQLLAALVANGPGGVLGVLLSLVGAWGTLLLFTLLPIHRPAAGPCPDGRAGTSVPSQGVLGPLLSVRGQLVPDPVAAGDPRLESAGQRRKSLGSAPAAAPAGLVVDSAVLCPFPAVVPGARRVGAAHPAGATGVPPLGPGGLAVRPCGAALAGDRAGAADLGGGSGVTHD